LFEYKAGCARQKLACSSITGDQNAVLVCHICYDLSSLEATYTHKNTAKSLNSPDFQLWSEALLSSCWLLLMRLEHLHPVNAMACDK
jgi:hypothetical protein